MPVADAVPHDASVDADFRSVLAARARGDFATVERLCRSALARAPDHAGCRHQLGLALWHAGEAEEAVRNLGRAVELEPEDPGLKLVLGIALHRLRRFAEAAACYREAAAQSADLAPAHAGLGRALAALGRFDEAESAWRRALVLAPDDADAHRGLGDVLQAGERLEEAESAYRRALALQPDHAEARVNLGLALQGQGRLEEAEAAYRAAVALRPDMASAQGNLGEVLRRLGRLEEAEAACRRALALDPERAEFHNNLAAVLHSIGRPEEGVEAARRAVALAPHEAWAHCNLGVLLGTRGELRESMQACRRALALQPDLARAHEHLGLALLAMGDYEAGLPEYEWRLRNTRIPPVAQGIPAWTGEDIQNRTVLVWAEQGIGDQIMFSALLDDLLRRGARCLARLDPRLEPLLLRSFPAVEFVAPERRREELPRIDYQVAIASLCAWLRPRLASIPRHAGYLRADPAARDALRARYQNRFPRRLLVGLSWRGGQRRTTRRRSVPLEQWGPILGQPGFGFVSLQYGDCADEIAAVRQSLGVEVLRDAGIDPLRSMDDLAAQTGAMDLVVSIDNSTVHLAGALGVPVWILLPDPPEWRWMLDRSDSPWYPSARLIRQPRSGDWDSVIETVGRRLVALARSSGTLSDNPAPIDDGGGSPPRRREQTVEAAFRVVLAAGARGDLAAVERLCRRILAIAPDHVGCLHQFGRALWRRGEREEAVRHLRRAAELAPEDPGLRLTLGNAYHRLRRFAEAAACYGEAVARSPDLAPAHAGLGRALAALRRLDEAESAWRRALEIAPEESDSHSGLGDALQAGRKFKEAEAAYRRALALNPDHAEARLNLGAALHAQNRLAEAEAACRAVIAARPNLAAAHSSLGQVLLRRCRLEEAEAACRRAIELKPQSAEFRSNLAVLMRPFGRRAEGIAAARQAIALKPDLASAYCALGVLLADEGEREESLAACRRAIELDPGVAPAHEYAGRALLQAGELEAGLAEWEWRLGSVTLSPLAAVAPAWSGEALQGRTILVLEEQGIGDQIMFAGLIGDLLRRGPRCLVQLDPRLEAPLRRAYPAIEFVGRRQDAAGLPPIDFHVPLAGLWRWLRPRLDMFPRHGGYLQADPATRDALRRRYREQHGARPLVGLSWRGGRYQQVQIRSIALERLAPILRLAEFGFVSLQYGDCATEIAEIRERLGVNVLHDPGIDPLRSIDDLAAQTAAMDLVVSIDNSTVHMAGALGIPVWVLLPKAANWRWMLDRADTPWYPSARLFRQERPGDWDSPIEAVRQRLVMLAERGT